MDGRQRMLEAVDRATASIEARSVAEPGRRLIYGPGSFYVFSELLRRNRAARA